MKTSTGLITGIATAALLLGVVVAIAPASSATVCNDGSFSMSSGSGTCSWHGGIMGGNSSRNYGGSNSYGLGGGSQYNDPFGYGGSKRGGNSYGWGLGSTYNSKRYGW